MRKRYGKIEDLTRRILQVRGGSALPPPSATGSDLRNSASSAYLTSPDFRIPASNVAGKCKKSLLL